MVFILKLLHGAYAYLLIFQIGVVAVLTLMLLWLIVRRTKMQVLGAGVGVIGGAATSASSVSSVEVELLKSQIATYESERTNFVSMKNDYDALQQKVKFLESKLLEYEILQEEIGTLSSLKVENEKLKKELIQVQSEVGIRQKQFANEPQLTPMPATVPTPSTPEPVTMQPTATVAAAQAPEPAPSPLSQLDSLPVAPEPVMVETASVTSGDPVNPDLDNLLKEIDALTGTK